MHFLDIYKLHRPTEGNEFKFLEQFFFFLKYGDSVGQTFFHGSDEKLATDFSK